MKTGLYRAMIGVTLGLSLAARAGDVSFGLSYASGEAPYEPVYVEGQDVSDVNVFYQTLSPHGRWIDMQGMGLCWQPAVAVATTGWHPYCQNGRWVWSTRGWYWQSSYPWGWAPFHYGRWTLEPSCGWVWVPGTVWAPAWVNWRYDDDSHLGWAPLPPGTTFMTGSGLCYGGRPVGTDFGFGLTASHYVFVSSDSFLSFDIGYVAMPWSSCNRYYEQSHHVYHGYNGHRGGSEPFRHELPPEMIRSPSRRSLRTQQVVMDRAAAPQQPAYTPMTRSGGGSERTYTPAYTPAPSAPSSRRSANVMSVARQASAPAPSYTPAPATRSAPSSPRVTSSVSAPARSTAPASAPASSGSRRSSAIRQINGH